MSKNELTLIGAVVYWNIAPKSNRQAIIDGFENLGLKDCEPPKRTAISAAREALEDAIRHKDCIIRPLDNKSGLVALQEIKGDETNTYQDLCYVKVSADDDSITEIGRHGSSEGVAISEAIKSRFASAIGECDQNHTAKALGKVVRALGGITLRPNGGVYWVPEFSLDLFRKAVEVAERSAIHGHTQVHLLQTAKDEHAVRAVHESLVTEVKERVEEINAELTGDKKISETIAKNRRAELAAILDKVRAYESLLQENLGDVLKEVEKTVDLVSVSNLVVSSANGQSFFDLGDAA